MAKTTKIFGVLPVNKGAYSSEKAYYKDNLVQYQDCTYICAVEGPVLNEEPGVSRSWSVFAGMPVTNGYGTSPAKVVSQKSLGEALRYQPLFTGVKASSGTDFADCIEHNLTIFNAGQGSYSETNPSFTSRTYWHTCPNDSYKELVSAELRDTTSTLYRNVAVFGRDGELLYQAKLTGRFSLWLYPGHTVYITSSMFISVPRYGCQQGDDSNVESRLHALEQQVSDTTIADRLEALENSGGQSVMYARNAGVVNPNVQSAIYRRRETARPEDTEIEVIDNSTIRVFNNSQFVPMGGQSIRGFYLPINISSLEDLRGLRFHVEINGIDTSTAKVKAIRAVSDWGGGWGNDIAGCLTDGGGDMYRSITRLMELYPDSADNWRNARTVYLAPIIQYSAEGFSAPCDFTVKITICDTEARVCATEFAGAAREEIDSLRADLGQSVAKKLVCCWGDSLTAGTGSNHTDLLPSVLSALAAKGFSEAPSWTNQRRYADFLGKMLGSGYDVRPLGVGGEACSTIACRMGANPIVLSGDVVLPADTAPVEIAAWNSLEGVWGSDVRLLLQGQGNSVNPCYVRSIPCTLTKDGDNTSGSYYLARNTASDRPTSLKAGDMVTLYGANAYRGTDIAVIWAYTNNLKGDLTDVPAYLKKMADSLSTPNYIVVGSHGYSDIELSKLQGVESALAATFGARFLNWRLYACSDALSDFGLPATGEDDERMAAGYCPSTLLTDKVHLSAAGYAIFAYYLYNKMKELGYV